MNWHVPFPEEGIPKDGGTRDRPAEPAVPDSDGRLAAAVYGRLLLDPRVRSAGITVRAQSGVVLLGGSAASEQARAAAVRVAEESGARDVLNEIRVRRRRPRLLLLLLLGGYTALVAAVLGVHVGWIALVLICALVARHLRGPRPRGPRPWAPGTRGPRP